MRRSGCARDVVRQFEGAVLAFLEEGKGEVEGAAGNANGKTSSSSPASSLSARNEKGGTGAKDNQKNKPGETASLSKRVSDPTAVFSSLILDITDKFARLILHAICRYYVLVSYSVDDGTGKRLTYIRKPSKSDRVVKAHVLPTTSFFDYCFA
ncbi:hypothetical protein HK104_001390 [Borealophlyctis nickersoniae]|nr:hypothetical protein HK104_001390 [Borealophlyctis nickersoniae]